jgi:RNA polymerase sporulation-specific sigma factor
MSFNDNSSLLIELAKNGDKAAKDEIVENNVGLVWSIIKRFQNRGYESEDLFQIGCIGLIKAVDKFDTSFNVKFSTYAVPMIIGEIKRFLRDDGIIKVSRSIKELSNKARVTKEIMTRELEREPTVTELSERLNVKIEEMVMAMEASYTPESLFFTNNEGEGNSLQLIDKIEGEGEGIFIEMIDKLALRQILGTLKPRDKQIIILRYFKEKTQVQIAKILGISQVQVSRIEKRILSEIKGRIC